jgi:5-methylcytosine-specific restriction endonuclease McrA
MSPEIRRRRTRAHQRRLYWTRRRAWFADHGPCQRCGSRRHLEVDHIDPATKVSHSVWQWRQERREAELAKCQVLCRTCHHFKTATQKKERRPDFPPDAQTPNHA